MEDIRINQLIEVTVDEANTEYHSMASRIEGVDRDFFHISVPTYRGSVLPLSLGTHLLVSMIHRGDVFRFNTVISGRKRDPIPMLTIKKPDDLHKIQRRYWVRLAATLPVKMSVIKESNEEVHESTAQTIDISGGGLLLMTSQPLEVGQVLNMQIELHSNEVFGCKGKVIRSFRDDNTGKGNLKTAIEFIEISERSRDRIVKFIFERQREWIKKGVQKS